MIFGSEKVCLYAGSQPKIATSEDRTALKHIESSKNNTTTFYGSRKGTIQKNISNRNVCFFSNHCRKVCQSLITNPKNLVDPQITFSIIRKYLQIHKNYVKSQFLYESLLKISPNLKNIANPKKLIKAANDFSKNSKIV